MPRVRASHLVVVNLVVVWGFKCLLWVCFLPTSLVGLEVVESYGTFLTQVFVFEVEDVLKFVLGVTIENVGNTVEPTKFLDW